MYCKDERQIKTERRVFSVPFCLSTPECISDVKKMQNFFVNYHKLYTGRNNGTIYRNTVCRGNEICYQKKTEQ